MKTRKAKRFGFTLMELLAVMSIMGLLTTLAVTSYFSAVNGMAKRSAVKHVVNALILARQRACMEGVRVSVIFFNELKTYKRDADGKLMTTAGNEIFNPTFVVCRAIGRISYKDSSHIGDEFTDLGKMFGTTAMKDDYTGRVRIYNLTLGGWWDVKPWVESFDIRSEGQDTDIPTEPHPYPYAQGIKGERGIKGAISVYRFLFDTKDIHNMNQSDVHVGDVYGVDAAPASTLPKTFVFKGLEEYTDSPICVHFKPDGSLDTQHGGVSSITIVEQRGTTRHTKTISISTQSGSVDDSAAWN